MFPHALLGRWNGEREHANELTSLADPQRVDVLQKSMTHHHHETGHGHPARAVTPSLLRMSAAERFVAALAIAGVLWVVVWWVML